MASKIEIIEVGDGEIVGVETREIRVPISELSDYLLTRGFKHDGVWYFRNSWMKRDSFRLFEHSGLVEKVGTPDVLRSMGIKVPLGYKERGPPLIYRVIDEKINSLIPNQE